MKLSIILLVVFVLNAGAKGTAQTVSLCVKDMPLEKVCKEIERQTGCYFVYSKDMNKQTHLVSLKLNEASVEETLKQLFHGLDFTYELIGKVIVVKTINTGASRPVVTKVANERMIKVQGVVISESGQPLGGASVVVKKTGKITFTNVKGEFSFSEVPENSVLVITYVGYAPKQVSAKEEGIIRIQLEVATNDLDAMVIKGYYTTSNRLNTGDATTVKGEDIQKQPVTDPIMALEGRVAGLNIQQYSGVPGAYSTVRLRGRNSIANGLDPLYIVDGVPYSNQSLTNPYIGSGALGVPGSNRPGNAPQNDGTGLSPFNNLNPGDIESITILKDADATAIYGARGANGVILITTKKGKSGQIKSDINIYGGGSRITKKLDLMNTQEYLQMRREAFKNDGAVPDPNYDYDLTYWDTTRYTDWQKALIGNTANFTNAQANMSGGNANTLFLIGIGYSNQGTVFPGDYGDKKTSVHISLTNISPDRRFTSQFRANYVNDNNNLPLGDFTGNIALPPDAPAMFDKNGNLNWALDGGSATFPNNPMGGTRNRANAVTDNLIGNLSLGYQIFPGLKINGSFGYTHSQLNQSNMTLSASVAPPRNNDPSARENQLSIGDNKSWIVEPQINYLSKLAKGTIDAVLGSTFQENNSKSFGESSIGFLSDALVSNPIAAKSTGILNYSTGRYRYNAFYCRVGYSYMEKYLLNITARRDGSSRFGPSRRFGNFGAIGAGWIFSRETFMENFLKVLSFGKVRGSYGITGNDQLPDYKYLDTYSPYSGSYQGVPGLTPTQLTNPYYSWEKVKKLEGAIELGFLKDRIFLSLAYYRNRTNNQLVGYTLPVITGFTTVQANLPALIQNTGYELTLQAVIVRKNDFSWTSSANISVPRNKLLAYPNILTSSYKYSYSVGKSLFTKYVYGFTGVDPQTGLYTVKTKKGDGNPVYGVDQYFTKPITQDYYGGIDNSFSYKGFTLDIFIQIVKQNSYNYLPYFTSPGIMGNVPKALLARWQKYGDRTNIEKFSQNYDVAYNAYNNLIQSDGVIGNASYGRLKNLSISYKFSPNWLQRNRLQTLRIYLQAQNLFTVTNYKILDPEVPGLGLPPLRVITAGMQFGF